MDEDVQMSARAWARIVEQARAARFEAIHRTRKIRHFQRDMMQSFAALLNELRDHRVWAASLQQFNTRAAGGQHRDVHFLQLDRLPEVYGKTELLLIEVERGIQRSHGDAEVINLKFV